MYSTTFPASGESIVSGTVDRQLISYLNVGEPH
jgi:hypothetical protein